MATVLLLLDFRPKCVGNCSIWLLSIVVCHQGKAGAKEKMFKCFLLLGEKIIILILIFLYLFFQQQVIHMLSHSSQLAPHYWNCGCYCQTAEMRRNWLEKRSDYSCSCTHCYLWELLINAGWKPVITTEARAVELFVVGDEKLKCDYYSLWNIK